MDRLRVGIVGCGGVSRDHISGYQALPDRFTIAAVCDQDAQKAGETAARVGLSRSYTELEDMLNLPDLDVIDICTPPFLHFSQIQQALAAGRHVICEKPLVGSLQEIDALARLERQSGKRLMPILQYRFGNGIQKLTRLVESGITGQPFLSTVEVAWHRGPDYFAAPWRTKWETALGGVLPTHAIHALDLLMGVTGPASQVYTRMATLVNPVEVDDSVAATFSMANGSLATLSATLGSVTEITRLRFCFRALTAESNTRPYTSSDDPWTFTGESPEVDRQIVETLAGYLRHPTGYPRQFRLYYDALASGSELPVTPAEVRSLMGLITAMYYSARTGQAVELPLPDDHPMYKGWIP